MESSWLGALLFRIEACWNWVEQTAVGLLGLAALMFGVVQVIGRYVAPTHAIAYAEEVIVYLLVWAVMITASQLVWRDGHVRSDLVLRFLSPVQQRWLEILNCTVAMTFVLGLFWFGLQVVDTALLLDERSASDLQFPMYLYYSAIPVSGALMAVRYAVRLTRLVFFYRQSLMNIGHVPAHEKTLLATDGELQQVKG